MEQLPGQKFVQEKSDLICIKPQKIFLVNTKIRNRLFESISKNKAVMTHSSPL
jgi:hypothetical protein